jgi:type IV fimbrial biogenesis protein FimT
MRTPRAPAHGFTMVELVVAMTVAGVLLALAVPSFTTFIYNQRATSATNSLVLTMNLARSEAIKRDLPTGITVCASADHLTCGGGNWATGWVVLDTSGGANAGMLSGGIAVPNNTVTEATGQTQVVYQSNGTVTAAASFRICDTRGAAFAHSIDVGPTGRVLAATTVGQTVNGAALVCP